MAAEPLNIAVDFHGVICEHPRGSNGATEMDWPEVPGSIAWLREMTSHFRVHLISARFGGPYGENGIAAAREWLIDRGIPSSWLVSPLGDPMITLTASRPKCHLTVDDRAWCFKGVFPTVGDVKAFVPWNR